MGTKYDKILGELRENDGSGGSYVLPPATASELGGVKIGAGLAVALDGLLSAALPTLTKETIATSGTWTAPADGVATLILVGGGGGGGGGYNNSSSVNIGGGGGGGGGIRITQWAVAAGDQIAIALGAGGTAGQGGIGQGHGSAGGNGTATSATYGAATMTANGGKGGNLGQTGGIGGLGGDGDLHGCQGACGGTIDMPSLGASQGVGGWPNGGAGGRGNSTSPGNGVKGGDGYAILFFAARPAAQ